MIKLEQLKVAYEATTAPEWVYDNDGRIYGSDDDEESYLVCDVVGNSDDAVNEQDVKNAEFIALAHNLMPALLEVVTELGNFVEYLNTAAYDGAYEGEIVRALRLLEKLK